MRDELGLCDPPVRRFLYVGQDEGDSGACWYEFHHDNNAKIYVVQRALKGVITGLRLTEKQFRGESKWKLDIMVDAGKPFAIRSGVDTVFTRGVVLALAVLAVADELAGRVLFITVAPSKDNAKIVFGAVYKEDGQRVKYEWNAEAELVPLIRGLQGIVGDGGESEHEDDEGHGSDAADGVSNYRDGQPRSESRSDKANESQIKELKRVGAQVGFITTDGSNLLDPAALNAECRRLYPHCPTINDLTGVEAIEFRKTLLAM